MIPFGACVEYKPASLKEKSATQKFSPRTVRDILAGYHYHSGGDWSDWSVDCLVYDETSLRVATAGHWVDRPDVVIRVHRQGSSR